VLRFAADGWEGEAVFGLPGRAVAPTGRRRLNELRAARSSGHRLAASMRDVLLQAPQERLDQLGASGPAAAEQASHVAGPTLAIHRLIRL